MIPAMDSARRTSLFREVNDRIYELLESAEPDLPGEFLCECGHECGRRVVLLPAAFAGLRRAGRRIRATECRRRLPFRSRRSGDPVAGGLPALG
jgi:hypothetical protein